MRAYPAGQTGVLHQMGPVLLRPPYMQNHSGSAGAYMPPPRHAVSWRDSTIQLCQANNFSEAVTTALVEAPEKDPIASQLDIVAISQLAGVSDELAIKCIDTFLECVKYERNNVSAFFQGVVKEVLRDAAAKHESDRRLAAGLSWHLSPHLCEINL